MKKILGLLCIVAACAVARAGNSTDPHIILGAGYAYKTATNGTITGFATDTVAYVCIPFTNFVGLTASQATGDVRQVIYCLMTQVHSFTDTNMYNKMQTASTPFTFQTTNVVKQFNQNYIQGQTIQPISE